VSGCDVCISQLPPAAEPRHTKLEENTDAATYYHQFNLVDTSTNPDELLLHAIIQTTWDKYQSDFDHPTEFDQQCLTTTMLTHTDDHDSIESDDLEHYTLCLATLSDPTFPVSQSLSSPNHAIPARINALSALNEVLRDLGITRSEFYADLCSSDKLLSNNAPVRAHFDGGSMATTTDNLCCLWFYREFTSTKRPQMLQVANQCQHHQVGIGFLRIPTAPLQPEQHDTCFIRCLFTPTLPAMIVSPFDIGLQYNCSGYSCTSNFDGNDCTVRLHFPSNSNKSDLCFPQTLL
jgi:hypothetical protein